MSSRFDTLLDELYEVKQEREVCASRQVSAGELFKSFASAGQRQQEVRDTLRDLAALGKSFAPAPRTPTSARRVSRRAVAANYQGILRKADTMFQAGKITGLELCEIEARVNAAGRGAVVAR